MKMMKIRNDRYNGFYYGATQRRTKIRWERKSQQPFPIDSTKVMGIKVLEIVGFCIAVTDFF